MILRMAVIAALLSPSLAWAGDDEDDFFKESTPEKKGANAGVPDSGAFKADDDIDIPSYTAPVKLETKEEDEKDLTGFSNPKYGLGAASKMPLDVAGASPLKDNWAPSIVFMDSDAVVLEIPVLYARNRAEFDGVAYWLVAEAIADGKKVAESRMQVTRDAIADKGPSIQFFRMFAPVPSGAGVLEVRVSKASSAAGKPELLFTRTATYALGS